MGRVLVTGGAGYVGSHIVRRLTESGRDVVVVDDLSEGHRAAVRDAEFIEADFADATVLDRLLGGGEVEFIVHMAAFAEVGASIRHPSTYYDNNVRRSLALLDHAVRHEVRGVVFSSTAAVYGEPQKLPIDEEHPTVPTNTYGETKLAFERALGWYRRAYELSFVALRYFNAAGAHPDGTMGEDHSPESHLLPRLFAATAEGAEPMPVFGGDYPTADGSCVRDYVHVVDLAQAHVLAIDAMLTGEVSAEVFNLGNGDGFSVLQVVDTVRKISGRAPATRMAPRREGDPASLVASSARISQRLGWKAEFPSLDQIVETAWRWHQNHPRGYDDRG